jgi:hypothetical protein
LCITQGHLFKINTNSSLMTTRAATGKAFHVDIHYSLN